MWLCPFRPDQCKSASGAGRKSSSVPQLRTGGGEAQSQTLAPGSAPRHPNGQIPQWGLGSWRRVILIPNTNRAWCGNHEPVWRARLVPSSWEWGAEAGPEEEGGVCWSPRESEREQRCTGEPCYSDGISTLGRSVHRLHSDQQLDVCFLSPGSLGLPTASCHRPRSAAPLPGLSWCHCYS